MSNKQKGRDDDVELGVAGGDDGNAVKDTEMSEGPPHMAPHSLEEPQSVEAAIPNTNAKMMPEHFPGRE